MSTPLPPNPFSSPPWFPSPNDMSSSAVRLSSLSGGTSSGFRSSLISCPVRFLSAASYLKFPPIIFWFVSFTSGYYSSTATAAPLSCYLGLDLFLLIFPSLDPASPRLLPSKGFISIIPPTLVSSSNTSVILSYPVFFSADCFTWPSEEFDLGRGVWMGGPWKLLALPPKLAVLVGESTAIDSSPTSFFAIALVKSRQNLSTSESGISFIFPNRY